MNSKKCVLAALVGALIALVWLTISWIVPEWPGSRTVNEQEATGVALKAAASESGVYAMPAWKDNDGKMLQPVKMAKATAAGPLAFMVVHRQGLMRRVASSMIAGFLIHVIGAFLLCFMMLMVSLGGVAHRSMFRTDRRSTASISKQELVAFPYGLHLGVDCESCDRSYLEAERSAHRLGFGSVN